MQYETLTPPEANERLSQKGGWIYLDVRSVQEFEAGHVPGSYNIPLMDIGSSGGMEPNPNFEAVVAKTFAADSKLVVGCAAGGRSARACQLLIAKGFTNLVNMHGGFSGASDPYGGPGQAGWEACGFSVSTECQPDRNYASLAKD